MANKQTPDVGGDFEKWTGLYVQLRDKVKELDDAHEAALKPYKDSMAQLQARMQAAMEAVSAENIKTKQGTVYLSTRYSCSLADPDLFMRYVIDNAAFDLLDRKANSTAVRDFVEEKGSLPPGVNLTAIQSLGVRRASQK